MLNLAGALLSSFR